MSQFTLNLLVIGASFALYIGIAIWARAGSTAEFYAANRGVSPVMNGMATAADWMSAASFISMAGLIAFTGYDNSTYLMGWTGGYVLLAMLLAPYLRKFGKFTVPEFIGDRFYSGTARIIGVICLLIISITYVIGQMTGVGVTFSRYLEVSSSTGLWIGAALVFVYAVLGGMKGITYTQVAQYIVLIIAYTIPAVFIALQLTGHVLPQTGLFGTHDASGAKFLAKLDQVVTDLGFRSYTGHHNSTLDMVLFTMALMIGTAGLPHVIIRFFTVPKVADARKSAGWALVFIALLYTVAPAVGSMSRFNLTATMWPGAETGETFSQPAVSLEDIQNREDLNWMRNWQLTGLLNWEDKNGDGLIQYYNEAGAANEPLATVIAEQGLQGNELTTVNNDIMVLANPEIANLPGWVIAIVAAGGLAAALSTAAGLLLAISGAVSHDLIKGAINPGISEKGELFAARVSMAVSILVATILGLNPPGFAAQTVALAFGLAASSIFPVLMMGIFSTRMNKEGAMAGMLAGVISTLVYIFTYKGWFFISGTNMLPDTADAWLFGISPASFGTIGAVINFAVAYLVSAATKEPPAEVRDLVESIRVPRGAGAAQAH
ncbi:sodium:solute symporter family protein [Paracoccus sp. P2]|uniref:Cation acetate symporter n=1 Tax=Paracoccus pantotrophus TaxID=82367 RepID=A0A7H9BPM4_PARPN|nr:MULTISPECIES: sodium:solute symporter family protein [Paracoccus]MDF3856121.1 cation acetate symporter [Paracoccus pantotrophus]QLH13182.1 cation acetate symporter [Paracoccus pantotrophus]RDD96473.1 cation acetate symporter [Paracoccus pantotrophus]RNI16577.1 cation acetate symporter [Paracoccus pantotrophus]WGR66759.1 cation acetate symporter [Paracoccus pantotrophus]